MNRLANREICERAVSAVDEMIEKNKSCIKAEMANIKMGYQCYFNWKRYTAAPGAFALSRMYSQGYDVIWILTGKRTVSNK